jgi:hypothetical protein
MAAKMKKLIKEQYDRIKKSFEKIVRSRQEKEYPQLALQPIRPKKY